MEQSIDAAQYTRKLIIAYENSGKKISKIVATVDEASGQYNNLKLKNKAFQIYYRYDFVWNRNTYCTRQEAIVIEEAIRKGYTTEQDEKGNWSVYKVEIGRTKKLVAQYGRFE